MHPRLREFLFPKPTPAFFLRVAFVAACAYLFFGQVCLPFWVRGRSMEPTYGDGGFDFIWKPSYLFSKPERGDVVAVRLAGDNVLYLKRVVALAGQKVAFQGGTLLVDGSPVEEPYVQGPCRWNLAERQVDPGCVYLIGDNRSMPMEEHDFGQVSAMRIAGRPLW